MDIARWFRPDDRYEGVRPIHIWLLRVLFALVVLFVLPDSWGAILRHQGDWDPLRAAAVCMWAGYSLLSVIGVFHPLRMVPIVLFEIVYKSIWLAVVAYPLWAADRLAGSPAESLTEAFLWLPLPLLAMPWGYAWRHYVLGRKPV